MRIFTQEMESSIMDTFVSGIFVATKVILLIASVTWAVLAFVAKLPKNVHSPLQVRFIYANLSVLGILLALTLHAPRVDGHLALSASLRHAMAVLIFVIMGQFAYYMKSGGWRAMLDATAAIPGSKTK